MPSTYAHYRLGQEVYKSVSALARTAIKSHKELFDIGLHGPDILFYYRPLAVCTINKQGYDMHARSGLEFFKRAGGIFCEADEDDKEVLIFNPGCRESSKSSSLKYNPTSLQITMSKY